MLAVNEQTSGMIDKFIAEWRDIERAYWTIFRYSYDIVSDDNKLLFDNGWRAFTILFPNIMNIENRTVCHAWHRQFSDKYHLIILESIPTIPERWNDTAMNLADLEECGIGQKAFTHEAYRNDTFIISDLRRISWIKTPIPLDYDHEFMKQNGLALEDPWVADPKLWWTSHIIRGRDESIISDFSKFIVQL